MVISMLNFDIYFISLKQDVLRREKLQERFPKYFEDMIYIDGVYGNELSVDQYFRSVLEYNKKHGRLITPGELGASLSHIKTLENFLKSDNDFALIIEDDIDGNDLGLEKIFKFSETLTENDILLCGGQTANGISDFQLGKKRKNSEIYEISKFSYAYVYGACCYLISKKAARYILNKQNEYLKLADNWDIFLNESEMNLLYVDVLNHTDDRSDSHLQKERNLIFAAENLSFLDRIYTGIFFKKNFNRIKNWLIVKYLSILGFQKIR
jgi:glycosyl transferase, family 25